MAQLTNEEIRELGSQGGKARAARLSKEQLREISRRAVKARWARAKRAERPYRGLGAVIGLARRFTSGQKSLDVTLMLLKGHGLVKISPPPRILNF